MPGPDPQPDFDTTSHLAAIVEYSSDAIVSKDLNGIIRSWNQGAERIFGFTAEEMIGTSIRRIIPPEKQGEEDNVLARIRRGEPVDHFETLRVRKDGAHVMISLTISPVRDSKGNVVGASKIARDITTRRLNELLITGEGRAYELLARGAALPEVLATLVRTIEDQGDGVLASVFLLNNEGTHLRLGAAPNLPEAYNQAVDGVPIGPSAGACGTAAFRGETVIVEDIATDPLWANWPDIRNLALAEGLRSCWSTPIHSLQGKVLGTFAMYFRGTRIPSLDQLNFAEQVSRTAATLIELKRADESRARLTSIVNSSADAIIGMNLDGIVTSWNQSAGNLYGYSADEILNRSQLLIVPEYLTQDFKDKVAAVASGEPVPAFDTVRVAKDGREIEVSVNLSTIKDEYGNVIGISGIHRDISARKALEKLQQDFLAMVTHELRNPLTTVKAVSYILKTTREYNEEAVDALMDQTVVLERLISDLLDASRIQLGELHLERELVDLAPVIQSCCEQVQQSDDLHVIQCELPGSPLIADCDATRIRQVLLNLLSNAIKYSDDGHIIVRAARDGDNLQMDVTDEGRGIPPDVLPHLFERFYRASQDHSSRSLGLGLFISRGIVESHGGTIWARSDGEGKGSTFSFTLPLTMSNAE